MGSDAPQTGSETLFSPPAGIMWPYISVRLLPAEGGVERGGEYDQPQAHEGTVEPGHQTRIKMPW